MERNYGHFDDQFLEGMGASRGYVKLKTGKDRRKILEQKLLELDRDETAAAATNEHYNESMEGLLNVVLEGYFERLGNDGYSDIVDYPIHKPAAKSYLRQLNDLVSEAEEDDSTLSLKLFNIALFYLTRFIDNYLLKRLTRPLSSSYSSSASSIPKKVVTQFNELKTKLQTEIYRLTPSILERLGQTCGMGECPQAPTPEMINEKVEPIVETGIQEAIQIRNEWRKKKQAGRARKKQEEADFNRMADWAAGSGARWARFVHGIGPPILGEPPNFARAGADPDSQYFYQRPSGQRQSGQRQQVAQQPPDPRIKAAEVVLGVEPGATKSEITAAFRKKSKTAHPDRGGSTDLMQKLNESREVLIPPPVQESVEVGSGGGKKRKYSKKKQRTKKTKRKKTKKTNKIRSKRYKRSKRHRK
jgi:hypothetical protein